MAQTEVPAAFVVPKIKPQRIITDQFEGIIRSLTVEDYDDVYTKLLPLVSRCSTKQPFHSKETLQSYLTHCPTYHPFVIRQTSDDKLVGFLELYRQIHLGRTFDGVLQRVVIDPDFRGKKIAQSACKCILSIAKDELNCGRVDLTVEKPDAKKVYSNLGFEPVQTQTMRKMFIELQPIA